MEFLSIFFFSAILFRSLHAQGPLGDRNPRASPQQPPNATVVNGDIGLTRYQEAMRKLGPVSFNAIIGQDMRWKDGIIPYVIDCSLENMPNAVASIKAAIAQWERKTCIRFVKWTTQKYHLTFFRNTHCWGNVGQVSWSHISVGPGCGFEHVMAHEIGHVVGLYHEQNRKDRDQYVKVHWENIGQFKDAFDIVKNTDALGIPYDYESIMHYPWTAFSSNGKITMEPIQDTHGKIPYVEISSSDIKLVSRMYDCPAIERRRGARRRYRRRVKRNIGYSFDRHECVDIHKSCEDWAEYGECQRNPTVLKECKRSCGDPSCFGGPCRDLHEQCPEWKEMGHCKWVDSVQVECQRSCNPQCRNAPTQRPRPTKAPRPPVTDPDKPVRCVDLHDQCSAWKEWGHCKYESVQSYCPKSCNPKCGSKPTGRPMPTRAPVTKPRTRAPITRPDKKDKWHSWPNRNYLGVGRYCTDKDPGCEDWAKNGECERNPAWMLSNCRKSCPGARCDKTLPTPSGGCAQPLGISVDKNGKSKIPDSSITATTEFAPGGGWRAEARNARLYFEDDFDNKRIGAWCGVKDAQRQYIEVDLGQVKYVSHIATQGRPDYFERVSKFKVEYSTDGRTFRTFEENGKDREFSGNCDHLTPVLNKFKNNIRARYFRYVPLEWNFPCVRMELFGC